MQTPVNIPSYLSVRDKVLYYEDVNLLSLIRQHGATLEVSYTDTIKKRIRDFQQIMSKTIAKNKYPGSFYYAYACKANYRSEVLTTAANYADYLETSSAGDLFLFNKLLSAGGLKNNQTILCNGTKTTEYFNEIEKLKMKGFRVIPIIENMNELEQFLKSDLDYEIGLRIHLSQLNDDYQDKGDRFGLTMQDVKKISQTILNSQNLKLKLVHFHLSKIEKNESNWIDLVASMIKKFYAPLRKEHKELSIVDMGGGLPVQYDYSFNFNYETFASKLISKVLATCQEVKCLPPDLIGEYGRYTVADQGFDIVKVVGTKTISPTNIWYTISNSIMTRMPDAWALKQQFIILPINLWENKSKRVKLAGITCDPDDIYYFQNNDKTFIELPEIKEGQTLYLGIFAVGAYQEMISGIDAIHHCLISEGKKLIIYKDRGELTFATKDSALSLDRLYSALSYDRDDYLKSFLEPEKELINTFVKNGRYRLACGSDLKLNYYKKTFVLDKKVFGEELAEDMLKIGWFEKNPETHVALIDNVSDQPVGYISCFCPTDAALDRYLAGKMTYFDFKDSDFADLSKPGFYNLYVFSTVVEPSLQGKAINDPENGFLNNKKVFSILNEALVDLIDNFAQKNILFKTLTFDSINRNTDKYAEKYDLLPYLKSDKEDGLIIYHNEFGAERFKNSRNYEKLFKYYKPESTAIKRINSTPLKDGYTATADFDSHSTVHILWPERPDVWRLNAAPAQETFVNLVKQISRFEDVVIGVTNLNEFVNKYSFNKRVKVIEIKHNDSWARDTGPVVLKKGDTKRATWFGFNAYGGRFDGLYSAWNLDRDIAKYMCEESGLDYYSCQNFILEGGSVVSNGKGTVMVTEQCLLNSNRNPNMNKEQIENKLKQYLGAEVVIWLKDGIINDETSGHVDNICNFVKEDEVVLAWPKDESDEQYAVSKENYDILMKSKTADGKPIKVHKLILPSNLYISDEEGSTIKALAGSQARTEGIRMAASYVNMLVGDKYVVLPTFNDESDDLAVKKMQEIYPDKEIIPIYSREILLGGGNVHCITKNV